jgi:hypothetical protein
MTLLGILIVLAATLWVARLLRCPSVASVRAGVMQHLIDNLAQAAKNYECENDAYPPGNGTGSAALGRALSAPGSKKLPYFEFRADVLTEAGDVRSFVRPEEIVHYRCPGLHNPASFDLWCADASGRDDGINNWE